MLSILPASVRRLVLLFLAAATTSGCDGPEVKPTVDSSREPRVPSYVSGSPELSDFARRGRVIEYVTRQAVATNDAIWRQRVFLTDVRRRLEEQTRLKSVDMRKVARLAERYQIPLSETDATNLTLLDALLQRADIIPESLVLARALHLSDTAQSDATDRLNNYLGVQCDEHGCLLSAGAVTSRFETVLDNVKRFAVIVNTDPRFERFRDARHASRAGAGNAAGAELAAALPEDLEGPTLLELIRSHSLDQFENEWSEPDRVPED